MKTLFLIIFLFPILKLNAQFNAYPPSDPRSLISDQNFVKSKKLISLHSETHINDKLISAGNLYFDSLGRYICYENFDSNRRITYIGNFKYQAGASSTKFTGFHVASGKYYSANFYFQYHDGLLIKEIADSTYTTTYTYDKNRREITRVTLHHNLNLKQTMQRGYSGDGVTPAWIRELSDKNGQDYLESERLLFYNEKGFLIREEETRENTDSSSNFNMGSRDYVYNNHNLIREIADSYHLTKFYYYPNQLLSMVSSGLQPDSDVIAPEIITRYRYSYYSNSKGTFFYKVRKKKY